MMTTDDALELSVEALYAYQKTWGRYFDKTKYNACGEAAMLVTKLLKYRQSVEVTVSPDFTIEGKSSNDQG